MDVSKYLTYEDLKSRGYDLNAVIEQGHFNTQEEANADFIQMVVDSVIDWITTNRGVNSLGERYFEAFSDDDNINLYPEQAKALKKACLETAIFWLDNYDSEAEIKKESIKEHSPKAEKALYNASIIIYGC